MKSIRVRLGGGYHVRVGPGLLMQTGTWLKELGFGDKLVVITDTTVWGFCGGVLRQSLASSGFRVLMLEVPEGEEQKSLETAGRLYHRLTELYAERDTPILALGGGVIGDLGGFVAATYLRGVPLIQLPTTLLAQGDSSIGGKVAVNHGLLKNKIGAFYQPRLVISDVTSLKTLDNGQLGDGLAEIIKHGAIRDAGLFDFIEDNIGRIKSLDDKVLETIVSRSVRIKAEVVAQDERDLGLRNILNFGHTVGHAFETISDFRMRHGEAVAVGMVVAAKISSRLGMLDKGEVDRLRRVLTMAGLPTEVSGIQPKELIQVMKHDKKIAQGRMKFVLLKSIGEAFVTDKVSPSLVEEVLVK